MTDFLSEDQLKGRHDEEKQQLHRELSEKEQALKEYRKEHGRLEVFFNRVIANITPIGTLDSVFEKTYKKKRKSESEVIPVGHVTDSHMGAVQEADEIEHFNEFNPDICDRRNLGFIQAFIDWVLLHRNVYNIRNCHLIYTGDLLCFPAGTMITMSNGSVKNIEDIQEGEFVLSDPEPRRVLKLHKRIKTNSDRMLEIKTCKGLPLIATDQHVVKRLAREYIETGWNPGGKKAIPFVVRDKSELSEIYLDECKMNELRPGDYLVVNPFRKTDKSVELNISEITGLKLLSDGDCLYKKVRGTSPSVICSNIINIDNDFLWMLGLFLAEGSFQRGKNKNNINGAQVTLNVNEDKLAIKFSDIIYKFFGYRTKIIKNESRSTQNVYINNQIIATLINRLCGEGVTSKQISEYIYNLNRSLLPLVAGWIDGDGGINDRRKALIGVTVNPSLARQISNILFTENVSHGFYADGHGRNRIAYRLSLTGESFQRVASYSESYNMLDVSPMYEDGIWAGGCYCLRIVSISEKKLDSDLYDLTIEGNHYYQANGYVVHNSGDIHDELRVTNAFPVPQQVVRAAQIHTKQIALLSPYFERVTVDFLTEDNHSRLTKKPQAKEAGLNSYGYLVAKMMEAYLEKHQNVAFNIHAMNEKVISVLNRNYLITHGHNVKAWMGIPWYGIERKVAKEATARQSIIMDDVLRAKDIGFHKMIHGHFHLPSNNPLYSCGGSVSGTDAYDHQAGRHAGPSQSAWMVHPKYGEFNRNDFDLKRFDNE